jgi:citrate/tricarballylate utilization protein
MSGAEAADPSSVAGGGTQIDALLLGEVSRQLSVCNACRYCEGLCPVFPALERRNLLALEDMSQLANLCHDCRACFDACMYTAPHEFAINVPEALSQVRLADYGRHVWPQHMPRLLSGWSGLFSGSLLSSAVMLAIALGWAGPAQLVSGQAEPFSPYRLIPYPAMLALFLAPAAFSVAMMVAAGRSYWVTVNSGRPIPLTAVAVLRALASAATLRYMRGGGGECYYPEDDRPSRIRRWLHYLVVSGFGLCVLSTLAASVLQDVLGDDPPYPVPSVPVMSGLAGGVLLVAGSLGLLVLKARSSPVTGVRQMTIKDYGLITALVFLGASGLATLFTRDTPAYGIVLLVHLASVLLAFWIVPYTKFMHVVFRFLALARDDLERTQSAAGTEPIVGAKAR